MSSYQSAMRSLITAPRVGSLLAILVTIPVAVGAPANEGPAKTLEVLWQFDTGG